jgi:hypothetical protein
VPEIQMQTPPEAAQEVRITALERDVRDIKLQITDMSREIRSSLSALGAQISDRARPAYLVQLTAAGLVASLLTTVGYLALTPVRDDVAQLKAGYVPRLEYDRRAEVIDHSVDQIERRVDLIDRERYQETREEIATLRRRLHPTGSKEQP